jgi:GAF domain-containing protein
MRRTRELFQATPHLPAPSAVFNAMCQDASEELGCELVSIWLFDASKERIRCEAAFDASKAVFSAGQILLRRDYPTYFGHLLEETFIKAPDARRHRWTSELAATYFEPHGIVSMLDYILHDGATPQGVICCESRKPIREWTEPQASYLLKLTALASRYFWRSNREGPTLPTPA